MTTTQAEPVTAETSCASCGHARREHGRRTGAGCGAEMHDGSICWCEWFATDPGRADDEAVDSLLTAIAHSATEQLFDRMHGDRTGTVAALREIVSFASEALVAAGAAPVDAVPTPAATVKSAPEPAAETPADDSPAARTASYASRATTLHGRLVAALGDDVYASISAYTSGGHVQVGQSDALAAARVSAALLPGGEIKARVHGGLLWIETTGAGVDQGLEIVAPVPVADQIEARAWLAELGVEVRP